MPLAGTLSVQVSYVGQGSELCINGRNRGTPVNGVRGRNKERRRNLVFRLWLLNHMYGERSTFSELDDTFKHVVKLRNNMKMDVSSKEDVKIRVNGLVHVINNLLSLGQLQERGLTILIQSRTCRIYHPKKRSDYSDQYDLKQDVHS